MKFADLRPKNAPVCRARSFFGVPFAAFLVSDFVTPRTMPPLLLYCATRNPAILCSTRKYLNACLIVAVGRRIAAAAIMCEGLGRGLRLATPSALSSQAEQDTDIAE